MGEVGGDGSVEKVVGVSRDVTAEREAAVGGMVTRVELDAPGLNSGLSRWYRLAYVEGGSRLKLFENYFATIENPQSDIVDSQLVAWQLANEVVGSRPRRLPDSARARTGADFGSSAGPGLEDSGDNRACP